MKVAFFNYLTLEFGGGLGKYFIETASTLQIRYPDLQISIVTFDEETLSKILALYKFYFLGKQDTIINKEPKKDILKKLGKVKYIQCHGISGLKSTLKSFDLIYSSNNLLEVLLLGFFFKYKHLPPVIYGFHIPTVYQKTNTPQAKLHNVLYQSLPYRYALQGAKKLHVTNSFDEKLLHKLSPKQMIKKIYYPFNFSAFAKQATCKLERSNITILWLGRLTEQKGVDDLVWLVNKLNSSSQAKKITWSIAGDGELKNQIINLSNTWKNVSFHGYITNQQTTALYATSNLFICTSKWESFPYVLLEAQSFGLPIISYNIPGCNEIIENNKNGLLVSSREEFAETLTRLITKNQFNKQTIQKYIHKKFNYEESYKQMYQLLAYD